MTTAATANVLITHILTHAHPSLAVMTEVLSERARQIVIKGHNRTADDRYDAGELVEAACSYALASNYATINGQDEFKGAPLGRDSDLIIWPWNQEAWKPDTRRRMLVKAMALLVAEVERIEREGGK